MCHRRVTVLRPFQVGAPVQRVDKRVYLARVQRLRGDVKSRRECACQQQRAING